jgi:hypothetical protein
MAATYTPWGHPTRKVHTLCNWRNIAPPNASLINLYAHPSQAKPSQAGLCCVQLEEAQEGAGAGACASPEDGHTDERGTVVGRQAAARAFLSPPFEQLFRGPQHHGMPSVRLSCPLILFLRGQGGGSLRGAWLRGCWGALGTTPRTCPCHRVFFSFEVREGHQLEAALRLADSQLPVQAFGACQDKHHRLAAGPRWGIPARAAGYLQMLSPRPMRPIMPPNGFG